MIEMNFGIEITGSDKGIIDYMLNQRLNPVALSPIQLYRQHYEEVAKEKILDIISKGPDEGFYVNRTRGEKFNRTYYTTKAEILAIIQDQIDGFSGLDLVVSSEDFTWVFVTNHDGMIYKVV
jgi:hypothetical protein